MGFLMMGGKDWTFGPVYLKDTFYALQHTDNAGLKLSLLALRDQDTGEVTGASGPIEVLQYGAYPSKASYLFNGALKRFLNRDPPTERLLKKHGIDALFGITIPCKYPGIATLTWVPDFQHRKMPEMFGEAERRARDRAFRLTAKVSTRVTVLTRAVKEDFEDFAPEYAHKIRVLRPVSHVPEAVYARDPGDVLKEYGLPEKFFFLPNQFWKHKNHEAVFQAVRALNDGGKKVCVVCAGNTFDGRHPMYFAELFSRISRWGIRDNIKYIGLIPKQHVLTLMRQSICVINPSFFEGLGYTVEEARSLGKRMVLSDIPTHREQSPPKAQFFDPRDSAGLGEILGRVWDEARPGPDMELEAASRRDMPDRLRAYSHELLKISEEAVGEARR